ncbi:hypothetical protein [Mesorhizobium argentiipisi]|uniref:Uncharacterized protein n=1 Tax=Mesorhizobium argentiipisi TaxID=3015175 RepID=A0ABU8KCJ3_9HYPH
MIIRMKSRGPGRSERSARADLRQGKLTRANFSEDSLRRQKPHDAIERLRIRLRAGCQIFNRLLAGGQKIGDAEFDDDAQRL